MRLYRGLKEPYRSDRRPDPLEGVNFTDCPYAATLYAVGRRGQVLVLDVPDEVAEVRFRKQLWLNDKAERLMLWGRFDDYIVGILPAKELRRRIRAKGMGAMPDSYKSDVLKWAVNEALRRASNHPIVTLGGNEERLAALRTNAREPKPKSLD
jgi:hypothetical protein